MNQSILSVRVDKDDKKGFETFCNETGMNVSTAISCKNHQKGNIIIIYIK